MVGGVDQLLERPQPPDAGGDAHRHPVGVDVLETIGLVERLFGGDYREL